MLPSSARPFPRIPAIYRFAVIGVVAAVVFYATAFRTPAPAPREEIEPTEPIVAVPSIDRQLLDSARDATREQRLLLEPEPLRHLLGVAIDVGPSTIAVLGVPPKPLPVDEVRAHVDEWRGRWLWYEGTLEQVQGPRDGHPIAGFSIWEATVQLADGNRVIAALSIPPKEGLKAGSWVKVEGFLMKLRDTTYPLEIERAPFLVGREMLRDYADWGTVTKLDQALLDSFDDTSLWPGTKAWHTIEEDQTEPLWHLAAFVRDTANQRTLADWRKIASLNAQTEVYRKLLDGEITRGSPLRVFGTLVRRRIIAAPPNPAGIEYWTTVWVQVREFGGRVIPIWVPKRVDNVALRSNLEVRGFLYRWFNYEAPKDRLRAPLFVAADLDLYQLETDRTMHTLGIVLLSGLAGIIVLFWIAQRRAAKESLAHSRDMDARRRRRRERGATHSAPTGETPPA